MLRWSLHKSVAVKGRHSQSVRVGWTGLNRVQYAGTADVDMFPARHGSGRRHAALPSRMSATFCGSVQLLE